MPIPAPEFILIGGKRVVADSFVADDGQTYYAPIDKLRVGTDVGVDVSTAAPLPVADATAEATLAALAAANHTDIGAVTAALAAFSAANHIDLAAVLAALTPATPANIPGATGAITGTTGLLLGFSARETSGSATAFFRLRAGGIGGTILATVTLAAGESVRDWFGPSGITATGGVYYELVSGAVSGGVQTR